MATYDLPVNNDVYEAMERGEKTVYAVLATPAWQGISAGDRLEFGKVGAVDIGMVRRYSSLERLVEVEGYTNLLPTASAPEEAVQHMREIPGWTMEIESEVGVYCLRVRETMRKM